MVLTAIRSQRNGGQPTWARVEGTSIVGELEISGVPDQAFWAAIEAAESDATPIDIIEVLAPIQPSKIVCVGLNYARHARESGLAVPSRPLLFGKWPTTVLDPGRALELPREAGFIDYEAEVAVVMGTAATKLPTAEAARSCIGAITGFNDVTDRDAQLQDGQWSRGKGFDGFGPTGPYLARASDVDLTNIEVNMTVNGEIRQSSSTSDLVFDILELIRYVSHCCTLLPGDVIATGTPEGIGFAASPPKALRPGDVMAVTVQHCGTLVTPIS